MIKLINNHAKGLGSQLPGGSFLCLSVQQCASSAVGLTLLWSCSGRIVSHEAGLAFQPFTESEMAHDQKVGGIRMSDGSESWQDKESLFLWWYEIIESQVRRDPQG